MRWGALSFTDPEALGEVTVNKADSHLPFSVLSQWRCSVFNQKQDHPKCHRSTPIWTPESKLPCFWIRCHHPLKSPPPPSWARWESLIHLSQRGWVTGDHFLLKKGDGAETGGNWKPGYHSFFDPLEPNNYRNTCSVVSNSFVTVACQSPLSKGFPRQEYWSRLPFPSPGDLPHPGTEPTPPTVAGRFFTTEPPGKPINSNGLIYGCEHLTPHRATWNVAIFHGTPRRDSRKPNIVSRPGWGSQDALPEGTDTGPSRQATGHWDAGKSCWGLSCEKRPVSLWDAATLSSALLRSLLPERGKEMSRTEWRRGRHQFEQAAQVPARAAVGPSPLPLASERNPVREDGFFWDASLPSSQSTSFPIKVIPCSNKSSPDLLACPASGNFVAINT